MISLLIRAGRRKKNKETVTTEKPAALVIRILINEDKIAGDKSDFLEVLIR